MVTNARPVRVVGRYLLAEPIAAGGMATVYLARLMGEEGFSRTVALKQLHPHFSRDADFVDMFLDEARMLSRIRHPNVVAPLDVVMQDGELFIAMEYVHGETLSRLGTPASGPMPPSIASAIITQVLLGLHAAHEALGEGGQAMDIVHRDVSPQNILVGEDGVAKVVDFGIARALLRNHTTQVGLLKGKLGYMAPEQLRFEGVDRRTDIYGAGIVFWELLTGQRLFATESPAAARTQVLGGKIPRPSTVVPSIPRELDDFIMQALAASPDARFQNARAMALALGQVVHPASVLDVGTWVERVAGPTLAARAERIHELETVSLGDLTLAHPLGAPGGHSSAPPNVGISGPSNSVRPSIEHTGLSMAPSSITKDTGWRSSRARILVPTVIGLIAGGLGIAFLSRHPDERPISPVARTEPRPAVTAPSDLAITEAAGHPTAPATDSVEPLAAPPPSVTPAPPSTAAMHTVKPHGTASQPSVKPPHKPGSHASSCDPPYSIDADGIKHFKPECF